MEHDSVRLKEEGRSIREISEMTGRSRSAIHRALMKTGQGGTGADETDNGDENGNGHATDAGGNISAELEPSELPRRVRKAAASEDPTLIQPMLDKLVSWQHRLTAVLQREKENAALASKAVERDAVLVAENDKPEDEAKLATARSDLASAVAIQAALTREFAALARPCAERQETLEKRRAAPHSCRYSLPARGSDEPGTRGTTGRQTGRSRRASDRGERDTAVQRL